MFKKFHSTCYQNSRFTDKEANFWAPGRWLKSFILHSFLLLRKHVSCNQELDFFPKQLFSQKNALALKSNLNNFQVPSNSDWR